LTSSTAFTAPICFLNTTPAVRGKCLTRPSTRRKVSPIVRETRCSEGITHDLPREVARTRPTVAKIDIWRDHFRTDGLRVAAPGMEGTARRDAQEIRRQPFDGAELLSALIDA